MHGLDRPTIVAGLSEMGLSEEEASNSYDDVYTEFHAIVEDRRLSAASILRGIIGAGTAATVGGLVWGLIVAASDYEVGFLTWGLGFLAGYASKVASGKRGIPIQVIAVTGTVVALAVGKYFVYSSALWRAIEEEFGTQAASAVTPFSIDVLDSFLANFSNNFTVIDALWFPPAVVVAWIIPRAVRFRITISSSGGDFSL